LKPSAPCPEWRTRTQLMMEWNALKRQLMAHPKIADGFQELDKELDALIVGWEPDPAERKKDPYQKKLNSEKAWETRVKALSEKTAHRDLLAKLIPRFRAWGDWREAYNLSPDALPISKRITAQFVADAEKRNIRVPIKRDQARKIFEEWSQNSVSQEYSSADKQAAFEKFCDVGFRRIGPEIQEHRQALAKAKEAAGARLPDFEIIQRTALPVEHKKNRDTKIHPLDQSNGITTFGLSYSEDPVKQVVVLSLTAEQLRQTRLSKAQIEQLDGMIAENKARAASSPSRFITLHMLEKNSLQIIPEGSAQHQVPSPKRGGR
ncbi:MAG TPA: hypothetical protein VM532_18300, partial [Burkholderiales bacterium]|nr:hypothetical protein [Burkholderiales bacterium]